VKKQLTAYHHQRLRKDAAAAKNRLEELLEQKDRLKQGKGKENKKSKSSNVINVNIQVTAFRNY